MTIHDTFQGVFLPGEAATDGRAWSGNRRTTAAPAPQQRTPLLVAPDPDPGPSLGSRGSLSG